MNSNNGAIINLRLNTLSGFVGEGSSIAALFVMLGGCTSAAITFVDLSI